jgi:RNA polymerase sigma-70 factor (ECF subfamily)
METTKDASAPALTGIERLVSPVEEDRARWVRVVQQIQCGETEGMEALYKAFPRSCGYYYGNIGIQECRDRVHDAFLGVVEAILAGQLREPGRLMGFVQTVVQRKKAACIDEIVKRRATLVSLDGGFSIQDRHDTPEQGVICNERAGAIGKVMTALSNEDREILTRFYLNQETAQQICTDLGLTETQFRLRKSRAKIRFGKVGKSRFVRPRQISMRKSGLTSH